MLIKRKTVHLQGSNSEGVEDSKPSVFRGLFLGLMSGVSFSIVSVMVKWVANLHPAQLVLYRCIAMFCLSMPETVKTGQNPFGPREYRWLLVLRGIIGATTNLLMFIAFRFLSLSVASSIIFSSPIFVTVFARVFLKEPCGAFQFLAVLVTVIGVIFVTKLPSQLTGSPVIYSTETIYSLLAAIFAAVFLGFEAVIIRKIKNVHESIVMFNFCWVAIIATLPLIAILGNFRWHHCGFQVLYILLIGLFSYAGMNMFVVAMKSDFAGPVSTIRAASDIIMSFLWQIIIFRDSPDSFGITGAILIILSVAFINLSKWISHLPKDSNLRKKFEWIIA